MGRTLFSAGYAGHSVERFAAFVAREDLTIADLRLKPFSRMPGWSRKALAARFGDRYAWIPALGNLNYQGGPVRLQDESAGLQTLRALLEVRSVVVLCVCADRARCHRTVVTNALASEVDVHQWPAAMFLQAALNGDRVHPSAPRTPAAIAEAARAAVDAGARSVHVHAFDENGRETLDGAACATVLRAIRARCPGTPISLTTSAAIVPDPRVRLEVVSAWSELPDLVTANQGEPGIGELVELLRSRGVGIEAGLLTVDDARAFVRTGLAGQCRRVLIEPLDVDADVATKHAAEMEDVLSSAGIGLEQVHHGYDLACWPVMQRALGRGHGIRVGIEDVTTLPDGVPARDNADLIAAAVQVIRAHDRSSRR